MLMLPPAFNSETGAPSALLSAYASQVRVRVGGLLLRDGALLLAAHRGLLPDAALFWSPPGGGWQFGESIGAALVREFQEETGLAVQPGRFLHLHEFHSGPLQALELFFEVVAAPDAEPRLGHDPEHAPGEQLLIGLHWLTPAAWRALPAAQVHPVVRAAATTADLLTARAGLG